VRGGSTQSRASAGRAARAQAAPNRAVPNYRHAWLAIYALIYVPAYFWLESRSVEYLVIATPLDRLIPFHEGFVIFYLGWFVFMAVGIVHVALSNQAECYRLGAVLIIGMTISCLVYYLYPTTFTGRPVTLPPSGVLAQAVGLVYSADNPMNVFPSIHVYNTLAILIALFRCQFTRGRDVLSARGGRGGRMFSGSPAPRLQHLWLVAATVTSALIILSTVFVKQHSVLDILGATLLIAIVAPSVYALAARLRPRTRAASRP
jgi:membrane-associated phospholipid phosphatase